MRCAGDDEADHEAEPEAEASVAAIASYAALISAFERWRSNSPRSSYVSWQQWRSTRVCGTHSTRPQSSVRGWTAKRRRASPAGVEPAAAACEEDEAEEDGAAAAAADEAASCDRPAAPATAPPPPAPRPPRCVGGAASRSALATPATSIIRASFRRSSLGLARNAYLLPSEPRSVIFLGFCRLESTATSSSIPAIETRAEGE